MKKLTRTLLVVLVALASSLSASAENFILYTSWDGMVVTPVYSDGFGANIVSNTYEDGQGKILFDGEVTSIGDYAFFYCLGLTSINIPNSVTEIGNGAFYGCGSLTSINIPDGVTEISSYTFINCSDLTSIFIPNSVTSIGEYAFDLCSSLTSINIPDGVTEIGTAAFSNCSSLASINIPNSVTSIGEYAFTACSGLKEIISFAIVPPSIYSYTFNNVSKTETVLNVPVESVDAYKAADYWKEFTNIVGIDDTEVVLGDVNGDGSFTSADISLTVEYVLGKSPANGIPEAADANEDGQFTSADISIVVAKVLSGGNK